MSVPMPIESDDLSVQHSASGWFIDAGLGSSDTPRSVLNSWVIPSDHPDPLGVLERTVSSGHKPETSWAILLSYELGGHIEPRARGKHDCSSNRFPAIVIQQLGEAIKPDSPSLDSFSMGMLHSSMGRDRYITAVESVRAYIGAGDIYQANIAHHLRCDFNGAPRACANALLKTANPRYGAAMGFDYDGIQHTICSLSPELFMQLDSTSRVIRTEPMKGTRPIGGDLHELEQSPKDRAELNMITDLMRNDLGRVCKLGSVRVTEPRKIESHADSVLQASSVVQGTLRDGVGLGELIRATFPPGSVTGAPKVRAMQIIDELEQRPRDAYCGSLLTIDSDGNITASVSIRTAHIWGYIDPDAPDRVKNGQLVYPVGAGIVADSDPASEWEETQVKSAILRSALRPWLPDRGDAGA